MVNSAANRDERFFFMPDEPPASGDDDYSRAGSDERRAAQNNSENAAQRLLKKSQDELAALKLEIQAIKDAELSEVERLKKQSAELESRVRASEQEALRRKVAQEENVPIEALEYLFGNDEDALRGSARKLVVLIGSKTANSALGSRTQPAASQIPTLDEQIAAAEKTGNRVLSISLKNQKMRAV